MVGIPVSDKWVKQLRYVVTQLSMDGHLQQSLTQYRPQAYCSTVETESTAPEALTVAAWICFSVMPKPPLSLLTLEAPFTLQTLATSKPT